MSYEKLMEEARRTNDERDQGERDTGFAAPGDAGLLPWLDTAAEAIRAGIKTEDWTCVAEGLDMLDGIIARLQSLTPKTGPGILTIDGSVWNPADPMEKK